MSMNYKVKNGVTRLWDSTTLNSVLRQLRKLSGMKVVRDISAGTVTASAKSKKTGDIHIFLWGLQQRKSGPWLVRFDSKLIHPK